MTRMSVLNDALNGIINAERIGKRQVIVRPSSKVIVKFLQVMQKHGRDWNTLTKGTYHHRLHWWLWGRRRPPLRQDRCQPSWPPQQVWCYLSPLWCPGKCFYGIYLICCFVSEVNFLQLHDLEQWQTNLLPSRQFGYIVLTTSYGIMDHEEARRKHTGGKILGYFY